MSVYNIHKIIPSILTILAFMLGISAVKIAFNGDTKQAIVVIILSSMLDLLDGKLARALDATSPFGEELDSLSDLTCFGVATGLIVYSYSASFNSVIGWLALSCFSVAVMLRLVRFNLSNDTKYEGFFKGVPAPAGAGLALLPIIIDFASNGIFKLDTNIYSLYIFAVSFLIISNIPTVSIKYLTVNKAQLPFVIVALIVLFTGLFKEIWLTLSICGIIYILSIPVSILSYKRSKVQVS